MINPKVRFKKEDGSDYPDWKEESFAVLFDEYSESNIKNLKQYTVGKYGIKLMNEDKIRYGVSAHKLFHPRSLILGIGIDEIGVSRNTSGCVSPIYNTYNVDSCINIVFLDYHIKKQLWKNKNKITHKSTRREYEFEPKELEKLLIVFPDIKEQEKIAAYFSDLDKLIEAAEKQVEADKEFKKAMLQKMFPRKGELVPEIRFPGFTGDWEQRKLHTLMDFSNGFNGSAELYGKGIPFISVMDILNNDYITYEDIRGKVDIDDNTLMRFAVDYGDVLFQRSSENFEDAGSSNVYIGEKTAAFGGFVIRGKKKAEYDAYFMKSLLDSNAVRKQITSKAQGAQHINVSQETLSDIILRMPSIEEQISVGRLFATMNEAITLHQRKLDLYKNFKKAMMQQMFV